MSLRIALGGIVEAANSESVSSAPTVDVLGSQGISPGLRPSTSQKAHVRRRRALPYRCALHPYAGKPTGTRVRRDLRVVLNELLFPHQRAEIFAAPHIAVV